MKILTVTRKYPESEFIFCVNLTNDLSDWVSIKYDVNYSIDIEVI